MVGNSMIYLGYEKQHSDLKVELLIGNLWPSPFKEMRHDVLLTCGKDGNCQRPKMQQPVKQRAAKWCPPDLSILCCVCIIYQKTKLDANTICNFQRLTVDGNSLRISLIRTSKSVICYANTAQESCHTAVNNWTEGWVCTLKSGCLVFAPTGWDQTLRLRSCFSKKKLNCLSMARQLVSCKRLQYTSN